MDHLGHHVLTWLGRLLLLAAIALFSLALWQPQTLRHLDPILCHHGQQVVGTGPTLDGLRADHGWFATICDGPTGISEATDRVLALMAATFLGAVTAYVWRSHLTPPALSAPEVPWHG